MIPEIAQWKQVLPWAMAAKRDALDDTVLQYYPGDDKKEGDKDYISSRASLSPNMGRWTSYKGLSKVCWQIDLDTQTSTITRSRFGTMNKSRIHCFLDR